MTKKPKVPYTNLYFKKNERVRLTDVSNYASADMKVGMEFTIEKDLQDGYVRVVEKIKTNPTRIIARWRLSRLNVKPLSMTEEANPGKAA